VGISFVDLKVINPENHEKSKKLRFLVDSGSTYSFVPAEILKEIGIKPVDERTFYLANGQEISRKMGNAYFEYNKSIGAAPVLFAEENDEPLLGATTLEALQLGLDPFQRKLFPLKLRA